MDVIINNLSFSLNATMPIFFVMVIGWCLKKFRFLDETTTAKLNQLVFKFFLPAFLFIDLATEDFIAIWDTKMVVFCFTATLLSPIQKIFTFTTRLRCRMRKRIKCVFRHFLGMATSLVVIFCLL